jgi:hypothetical protein
MDLLSSGISCLISEFKRALAKCRRVEQAGLSSETLPRSVRGVLERMNRTVNNRFCW